MVLSYFLLLYIVKAKAHYLPQVGLKLIAILLLPHFSTVFIDTCTRPGTIFLWRTRSLVTNAEDFAVTGTRAQCPSPL